MFFFSNAALSFKRTMGRILVFFLSAGYALGMSFDIQGVSYDRSSVVTYSFYDSTRKIEPSEFIDKNADYHIYLARNEAEACQIVLRSKLNSSSTQYSVEFTDFTNASGDVLPSTVYEEQYISCVSNKNYGTYPDALVPIASGAQYTFSSQRNWPFYIQVRADETTLAGDYTASVTVKNLKQDGKIELVAEVKATVWDFTLPETPSMDTAFGLDRSYIAKAHGAANNPERTQELYEQYYEALLERKISPYWLPVDILSDEANAYMSDPRLTSFIIPFPADDAKLQAYYQKVQSNPEWAKKGYFYPIDEPWNLSDYARYDAITDRLDRLCPGYNMVTPFGGLSFKENGKTYYGIYLQSKSNIVCPVSSNFSDKNFRKQVEERRADGSKIWTYICCSPRPDSKYANIFTQSKGIEGRILMWQEKSLNITGLLYWSTTYWNDVASPWASAWTTPWTGNDTFGDGSLFYPGSNGPLASLRLQYISDGIEDYEYLTIAEELFGREYIDNKIASVTNTLEDYTHDDALLAKVRVDIGNDIASRLGTNA